MTRGLGDSVGALVEEALRRSYEGRGKEFIKPTTLTSLKDWAHFVNEYKLEGLSLVESPQLVKAFTEDNHAIFRRGVQAALEFVGKPEDSTSAARDATLTEALAQVNSAISARPVHLPALCKAFIDACNSGGLSNAAKDMFEKLRSYAVSAASSDEQLAEHLEGDKSTATKLLTLTNKKQGIDSLELNMTGSARVDADGTVMVTVVECKAQGDGVEQLEVRAATIKQVLQLAGETRTVRCRGELIVAAPTPGEKAILGQDQDGGELTWVLRLFDHYY